MRFSTLFASSVLAIAILTQAGRASVEDLTDAEEIALMTGPYFERYHGEPEDLHQEKGESDREWCNRRCREMYSRCIMHQKPMARTIGWWEW